MMATLKFTHNQSSLSEHIIKEEYHDDPVDRYFEVLKISYPDI